VHQREGILGTKKWQRSTLAAESGKHVVFSAGSRVAYIRNRCIYKSVSGQQLKTALLLQVFIEKSNLKIFDTVHFNIKKIVLQKKTDF
jgi:hypothetical protein